MCLYFSVPLYSETLQKGCQFPLFYFLFSYFLFNPHQSGFVPTTLAKFSNFMFPNLMVISQFHLVNLLAVLTELTTSFFLKEFFTWLPKHIPLIFLLPHRPLLLNYIVGSFSSTFIGVHQSLMPNPLLSLPSLPR